MYEEWFACWHVCVHIMNSWNARVCSSTFESLVACLLFVCASVCTMTELALMYLYLCMLVCVYMSVCVFLCICTSCSCCLCVCLAPASLCLCMRLCVCVYVCCTGQWWFRFSSRFCLLIRGEITARPWILITLFSHPLGNSPDYLYLLGSVCVCVCVCVCVHSLCYLIHD